MTQLFIREPLVLFCVVAGLGFLLGRIKIGDFSLGNSAVLFVGIAASAIEPRWQVPQVISLFGLSLFVYALGLSSGPVFTGSLRHRGVRDQVFVVVMASFASVVTAVVGRLFGLSKATTAGLFSGALSSTPSLAAVVDMLKDAPRHVATEPVVAYSVTYPAGVIGMILVVYATQRWWKADFKAEAKALRHLGAVGEELVARTIEVREPALTTKPIEYLRRALGWRVVFGRYRRGNQVGLLDESMTLQLGDQMAVVGTEEDVHDLAKELGAVVDAVIDADRSEYDLRRIFVSNPRVAGKTIARLNLIETYGARITRIRRGDIDLLPTSDMRLELGDRVRVLAKTAQLGAVSKFLGDSYRALSEIDVAVFSIGLALGLLLGTTSIPVGDGQFRLGYAGGPLVVGLFFGALGRTGHVVWQLPYSANITLRQLGLIMFLAGVGTEAGDDFAGVVRNGGAQGVWLTVSALLIVAVVGVVTLWVGFRVLGIPMSQTLGLLAGMQTQAVVATFASEKTGNDIPAVAYATVYAAATISKIILAQLLV